MWRASLIPLFCAPRVGASSDLFRGRAHSIQPQNHAFHAIQQKSPPYSVSPVVKILNSLNSSHYFQLQLGCVLAPLKVNCFTLLPSASMLQIWSVPER